MMDRGVVLILLLPVLLLPVGCGPQSELARQQSRVIQVDDPDQILLAATKVLRREFRRMHVDTENRIIETEPVEFSTTRSSGTARDLYRGRSRMRRIAHFSVGRRGQSSVARLRIDVERQDTDRVLTMQPPTQRVSDSPAYTPIERDAATTERQNTVWTRVRRDRRMERELLQELSEQFTLPAAEEANTETDTK